MTLFDDRAEHIHEQAVRLVEEAIAGLSVNVAESRLPSDGATTRYALQRGSAQLLILVEPPSDTVELGVLRVVAPVVRLPAMERRPELFQKLLEANARELFGAAFALQAGEIVVVTERSLLDLDRSEVEVAIRTVGRVADRYDDDLAIEFATSRSSDPPPR